jgi:nucleoid-associated protein YgaU
VADQLKALGVREDQMIVASLGQDIPYRYNGHHQLSKDRRVEIVPTYRTTEIVRPGSRLAQIARRHYGNPEYWVFIYEANRDQISDPSNVTPGIELEIPNLTERLKGMNETQAMEEALRLKEAIMKR